MEGLVYNDIRRLKKSGGNLYQNFADEHGVSRLDARVFLQPFLYGAGLSKVKPVLTEREALFALCQFDVFYPKTVSKRTVKIKQPEEDGIIYVRQGGDLVKVARLTRKGVA